MQDSDRAADIIVRKRRKGIYILPNLFTLAALLGRFSSLVIATNNSITTTTNKLQFVKLIDSLDGRVARMTNTQSAFGEQMDSLSDMVSFGVAPALIAYIWALKGLGRWGWIAAFVYCSCAALRLARFNVNTGVVDKRWFQGLPSPAAAALVVGFIWVMDDYGVVRGQDGTITWYAMSWVMFALTLYAGLTMVTNAPFYSFKDINFKRSVPFAVVVSIPLVIALINIHAPSVLFAVFAIYGFSGYGVYLWRKAKGQPTSVISTSKDEPDERGLHQ